MIAGFTYVEGSARDPVAPDCFPNCCDEDPRGLDMSGQRLYSYFRDYRHAI